ncbi:energy-coupling factor transporter transmembrane component T [Clostridiaceae bacterium M8S5]|nr:energy-coupling factor transporter transmembrane component T [Clostridiaceae bacterium M8S5]
MIAKNIDPRTKLFIVLCLSSIGVIIKDIYIMMFILILSVIICRLFECNLYSYYKKLKGMFKIILVIAIVQSIFTKSGSSIVSIAGVRLLTTGGIMKSVMFILRLSIVLISAAIISTSNYREIVQGLVQMKIPYEIAFMVSVGIRFLPIMKEEFTDALIAIQLRGIEIDKISLKDKLKIYSYIFTPVIAGSMIKARRLSITMETRAFRAYKTRTSYNILELNKIDYMVMLSTALISIVIVITYILWLR